MIKILNRISIKLGFVDWFDLKWSVISWARTPLTKLEKFICEWAGHNPNMKTIISETKETYCKRCLVIVYVWSLEPPLHLKFKGKANF